MTVEATSQVEPQAEKPSEKQLSRKAHSMISLFQTASGAWHIPSILMASSWLLGTIVTAAFMLANLRVNRDDRLKAFSKERDAASKILELEAMARPKPFKERLVTLLEAIDQAIIPALRAGTTKFEGELTPWQFAEMQKLCVEPSAAQYISMKVGAKGVRASTEGMMTNVEFILLPSLIQ